MGPRHDAERENVGFCTWSQQTADGDTRGVIEITDELQRMKRSLHIVIDVMEKEAAAQEKNYRDKRCL